VRVRACACVVHLRARPEDQLRPRTLDAPTSGITYWQIIDESSVVHGKHQNPLHQFPLIKSVTSWHGQKSVVSVVWCRFQSSITTTCWQLVADLLATRRTILTCQYSSPCRQQVGNKLATSNFPVDGEATGKRV